MKIKERIKAETPPLWKKIGNWSLITGVIISGITFGLDETGLDIKILGINMNTTMSFVGVTLGAIGRMLSRLKVVK